MNDDEHDRQLRGLFARLKEDDRANTPSFRAPAPATETPRRRSLQLIAVAATVVLVAIATLVMKDSDPGDTATISVILRTVAWRSPTDFLLATPGSEMLRTVPAVGTPDESMAIDRYRSLIPESTRTKRTPS
jgi:hypothetical protein